jgi:two-component system, OmpR family, response regulator
MLSDVIQAGDTDQESAPPINSGADPTSDTDTGGVLLDRVRTLARSIEDRVRRALTPPTAEVKPMRVLVVDDHPDAADALAAVLELLGCPVRACYDGPSALVAAADFVPQVCLLDLMMPGMDGLELAARLKEHAGGRPLLLVATTALGDWETRARTALAGFHYHLTKPVDIPTMIEAITRLGEVVGRRPAGPGRPDQPEEPPGTA